MSRYKIFEFLRAKLADEGGRRQKIFNPDIMVTI